MISRLLVLVFSLAISPTLAATNEPITSSTGQRVALVIGNGTYQKIEEQLDNPANDARAMAAHLRSLDIEVIEAIDLDYQGMRTALRQFDRALKGADAGLFYYAGHGMEYRGQNYLFPTDAILESEGDIGLGLIDMQQVLHVMETSVPTRLVFLDACRNNPLASNFRSSLGASRSASVGRGLGRIDAAIGTFIAYATAPGQLAADGKEKHSPFTRAMLQHLIEPGLEISQLMHKVRNSVIEATDERQVPWESSSLRGPFILNLDVTINPAPVATSATDISENQRAETVFWESIKDSDQSASFEAYLERFGTTGVFAPLAEARIRELQVGQAETAEASLDFDRRQVQEALTARGYGIGTADGIFGPRTRSAIKSWQLEHDGEASGYLTEKQVAAILSIPSGETIKVQGARPNNASKTSQPTTVVMAQDRDAQVKAASLYRKECNDGFAESCTNLGFAYAKGIGIEKDHAKSATFYRRGCEGGNARGCGSLGYSYSKGWGVEQDDATAATFYQRSCEGEYWRGCGRLGFAYYKGLGIDQDQAKAVDLTIRACEGGYGPGCGYLGHFHEKGLGVEPNPEKATSYYRQACDHKYTVSCGNLGRLYEKGQGVQQDYAKASKYHTIACDNDYGASCNNLGNLYQHGYGVGPDRAKAKVLYRKACDLDVARGCTRLGALQNE